MLLRPSKNVSSEELNFLSTWNIHTVVRLSTDFAVSQPGHFALKKMTKAFIPGLATKVALIWCYFFFLLPDVWVPETLHEQLCVFVAPVICHLFAEYKHQKVWFVACLCYLESMLSQSRSYGR